MIRLTKKVVLMGCLLLPLAAQAGQLSEAEFKAQAKQKAMQLGKTLKLGTSRAAAGRELGKEQDTGCRG